MTKIFRTVMVLALVAGAGLGMSRAARAAEGDTKDFKYYSLEFKGSRLDRVVSDINGDGLGDFAMGYSLSGEREVYYLRVCLQDKDTGFAAGKCSELKFPQKARSFDIGDIDGNPGAELVLLTEHNVKVATFSGSGFGSFQDVAIDRTIFSGTTDEEPRLLRCLWDVDGDGPKEIIIPTMDGPAIYKYSGGGLSLHQLIKSPAYITYRVGSLGDITSTDDLNQFLRYKVYTKRTSATYTVPDVFILDCDGDGKVDVATLVDNNLKIFPQTADGRFADSPKVNYKKSILPPDEKGQGFAGEALTFAELNGDGLVDIIMMKWGSSQERTKMDRYIYYAKPGLTYPDKPDQIIGSENAAVDFGIYDLNNDKRTDLVIPFFHFAPAQAFKIITENAIKIQFWVFLMKEDGRYTQDAGNEYAKVDQRVPVDYKIDILGMLFDIRTLLEGKFFPLIAFGHDVNGDGFMDLIADTGSDKLEIFFGNTEAKFSNVPSISLEYESAIDYDLADLNGDGKVDIITYYESKERTNKKRELAQKARQSGASSSVVEEGASKTPEGTRVKVLLSK